MRISGPRLLIVDEFANRGYAPSRSSGAAPGFARPALAFQCEQTASDTRRPSLSYLIAARRCSILFLLDNAVDLIGKILQRAATLFRELMVMVRRGGTTFRMSQ